jgi:hypothetical protein
MRALLLACQPDSPTAQGRWGLTQTVELVEQTAFLVTLVLLLVLDISLYPRHGMPRLHNPASTPRQPGDRGQGHQGHG